MDRSIPSEFAEFVRSVAIRALDRLSERTKELDTKSRAVIRAWSKLTADAKSRLIDELIADAQEEDKKPAKGRAPTKKSKK
jgi:hypothetical protein